MATLQFVDSIGSSPGVRLDLNDQVNYFLAENPDFSPPALRRITVPSMLRDGADIPMTAYDNRLIKLTLTVKGTGGTPKDDLGTRLQNLARELDRPNNILKWKATGAGSGKEVFFRTHRSPDFQFNFGYENARSDVFNDCEAQLEIIAEPFAFGLRVTQSLVTVNNDPAAGSNPCYFDVTGVTGDVPTPAFMVVDIGPTGTGDYTLLFANRRHGTPGGVYAFQCEAMTQGTDTTVQTTDAVMSGATNNYSRTWDNAGDTNTMVTRLTWVGFPASTLDARGRYRIFARIRRSSATGAINIRMRSALGNFNSPAVPTALSAQLHWMDLGLISIPVGVDDPVSEGFSNQDIIPAAVGLEFQAERLGGSTTTLDWDVILAVPASEELLLVTIPNSTTRELILDGPNDKTYMRAISTGQIFSDGNYVQRLGGIPVLAPNQTNRIALLNNVGVNVTEGDSKTSTTAVTVSFWPLFLDVVRS